MKNHYQTLNLARDASEEEVRKAFRSLAFVCHPDISGDAGADEAFLELRDAYETLIDPARRAEYDSELKLHESALRKRSRKTSVEDGRGWTWGPFGKRPSPKPFSAPKAREARVVDPDKRRDSPLDIRGELEIELEDAVKPACYTITLSNNLSAPDRRYAYKTRTPGGVYNGALLVVPGLGYFDRHSGVKGDLVMEAVLARHPFFRVAGDALYCDLSVMPWEAALGWRTEIPTLEGPEPFNIPPCASLPGMRRVEGKGLPLRNGKRGDLWVNLKLEIPEPKTYRERRLWAELAEERKRVDGV